MSKQDRKAGTKMEDERLPVVVLTGPTAAGKTALALELAQRFEAEIVNADSVQVFCGMDIGSAKPSLEERARIPHHLIDIVSPDEPYDAGRYMKDARRAIDSIYERGKNAFLVGGTGLYIRAALEGLIESRSGDLVFRKRLEAEHEHAIADGDPTRLHTRLAEIDPAAADKIHPNDLRRIIRALEIDEAAGAPASQLRAQHGFQDRPYRVLHLVLDPGVEALRERIKLRCAAMVDSGLLQEVRRLRRAGFGPKLRSMSAIGYRQMEPVVVGAKTLPEALSEIERDTRQFAKRQRTWLRKVPDAIWVRPDQSEEIVEQIAAFLEKSSAPIASGPSQ